MSKQKSEVRDKIKELIRDLDDISIKILSDMKNHEDWVSLSISDSVINLAEKVYEKVDAKDDDLDLLIKGSAYMTADECLVMLHLIQQTSPDLFERMTDLAKENDEYALFIAQRFEVLHRSAPIYKMMNPIAMSQLIETMRIWSVYRKNRKPSEVIPSS